MKNSAAFLLGLFITFAQQGSCQKPGEAKVVKIEYNKHLYLKALINGKYKASLILDTGADEVLLDEEYFKSTGIVINRSQQSQLPGAGGARTITVVLDTMVVQFDNLKYVPRYVPLMSLRSIVGEKADGVVGASFLKPYLTEIDYSGERILLHTDRKVTKGFDSIKLEVRANRYYLPADIEIIDGVRLKGQFQLDLGNGGTVYLTSPTAKEADLENKVNKKVKFYNVSGGAGGRIEGYAFRAKKLSIGNQTLDLPDMSWSTDATGALARKEYSGLLGNVILERFSVIIDFRNAVLYLKPRPSIRQPFVGNACGFSYIHLFSDGVLRVTGLFDGSEAEKLGLKPGDQILSLNGKTVKEMTDAAIGEILKRPGSTVAVVYKRDDVQSTIQLHLSELL